MSTPTGFVFDERCFWHDPGNYALMLKPGGFVEPYRHIENPDPKRRLLNLVQASGLLGEMTAIASRDATEDEHEIALRSAGCALAALDAVMGGRVRHAYALTRPPGHHAEPAHSMGFCVFSNAALAAQRAIQHWGLQRVALVDWDVHYGNGSDHCFDQRSDVLCISVHQQAGYLQVSGEASEIGLGKGAGYSLNIPLPAGCGHGAYVEAFERIVLPALDAFRPELIIVPCGYDAGRFDPLGRMLLDDVSFRWMTRAVMDVAQRHASGRLLLTHEGGYCPASVPFFGMAVLEELSGLTTEVQSPYTAQHGKVPGNALADHQREHIAQLARYFQDVRQRHWV